MATVTFDTLKFVHRLKQSGMPEAQAEALAEAFKDAQGEAELVTSGDLRELEYRLTTLVWKTIGAQTVVLIGVMVALKLFD